MLIAKAAEKMVRFYEDSTHDINHFLKVWAYARTIGQLEGLDPLTQQTLELAAIVHDIACPLCRRLYGSTDGPLQEREGAVMAEEFLKEFRLPPEQLGRICYLVGHHHTFTGVNGLDYQILLEADYLVNAEEKELDSKTVAYTEERVFRTAAGSRLLESIFLSHE
ncbi:MAG: HD domain-containing protein [Ruminococcaceae bacterium]|nr:HD domain-containing protein [Oscillospiraceae bacterium]